MEKFNKYMLSVLAIIFIANVSADNPGDEDVSNEAASPEEEQTIVEEVVEENNDSAEASDEDVVTLEKVVVTGSKIKRVQQEGALPLLVITKDDIDNSGFRNVTEALQSIPSANQYTQNESLVNNFTPNANELDLRNLGPGRILFLVNGRRTADYPVPYNNAGNIVNISTIPAGLVDRIEVLGQGASAIYGSDAVSGVVNVITVKGKDFSELDVDLIEIEAGGAQQASVTFTTGGFFGSSSWTFGVDHTQVDPIYYAGRDGYSSFTDAPTFGTDYFIPQAGFLLRTNDDYKYFYDANGNVVGTDPMDSKGFYGTEEFGIPCSDLDSTYFNFDKQDPEWNYTGSYPGYFCGYDYGSERFGGSSQTISNERNDTTIMATFNHAFDIGINLEARVYRYEDEAYYRSDINRSVSGTIYDPQRIQDHLRTSTSEENRYTPVEGCKYGYTSNGQLYCGDPGNIIFIREFSPDLAPSAESRADVEEELTDYFVGLSGITESGYEWTLGVNRTEYDYLNSSQEFTDSIYDYFYGKGATDENGDLLTSTYQQWYYEFSPTAATPTWADAVAARQDYVDYVDYLYDLGIIAYPAAAYGINPLPDEAACGQWSGGGSCFLWDRLSGPVTEDMLSSWLADDSLKGYSYQQTVDFTLTGEFELANKFIGFAFSMDSQRQSYKLTPSDARLDPATGFIQGSTIAGGGKRNRESVGLEFSIPVTSKLEANIATRYDKYDDASSNVGSRKSNMFSFAYRPNDKLLVRGSGSQSFRAPDMNYLFQEPSSGFYNGVIDYVACFANEYDPVGTATLAPVVNYLQAECGSYVVSVEGSFTGNTSLEEEEGENFNLGLVWEVSENATLYVDAYEVFLENAVNEESPYTILFSSGYCLYGEDFTDFLLFEDFPERDCDDAISKIGRGEAVDARGNPIPIGEWETVAPDYLNMSYLEYRGIDWSFNYSMETSNFGDFYFSVASSHILKSAVKMDVLADETDYLDAYTYEPRSQQNASVSWVYEDWSATIFADRLGHMEKSDGGKSNPHIITNVSVSYDFNPDIDVYFSIRNIENKMPQRDSSYGFPYYNQNYFSALGRYAAVGINYRF